MSPHASNQRIAQKHTPVLLEACLEALQLQPGKLYVDGTLGMGGHSEGILKRLRERGDETPKWVGVDQDAEALGLAKQRLQPTLETLASQRALHFLQANFSEIPGRLPIFGVNHVDGGLLLDLGVSSYQLDTPERGFSFMQNGPLDMRMSPHLRETAADVLNTRSLEALLHIFKTYGEEDFAYPIARAVVEDREKTPWHETLPLAEMVSRVYRAKQKGGRQREEKHPATRVFQALRIAVNSELEHLEQLLEALPQLMAPGSRVAILTFHSLEDRLVKQRMKQLASDCECPPKFPVCRCARVATFKAVQRKPIEATADEVSANPRARSAKLRIYERV